MLVLAAVGAASADPFSAPAASFSRPHPAVVRVAVPERDGTASYGSGSLVAVNESSGLVLTNWHVVRDVAGPIVVYFPDGFHSVAYLLRTDRDWDLAALAIRRPNVQPIPLATEPPRPGDPLTIAGYGSGSYRAVTGECTQYLSPGDNQPFEMIELSAPARNGDSGGPILNSRGELAGVLFGSAFGRTSGSYCGRLRWFLALSDANFRRISAQALLAQQSRGQQPPPAAINSAGPLEEGSGVRVAGSGQWPVVSGQRTESSNQKSTINNQQSSNPQSPIPNHALGDGLGMRPLVPVRHWTASRPPRRPHRYPLRWRLLRQPARPPPPTRSRPILAAIGALAVLYHAMRLLGRAVG